MTNNPAIKSEHSHVILSIAHSPSGVRIFMFITLKISKIERTFKCPFCFNLYLCTVTIKPSIEYMLMRHSAATAMYILQKHIIQYHECRRMV